MANPNRAAAYVPNRSPIEQIRCNSLFEAQCIAEDKRKAGFDARATQRTLGPRKKPIRNFYVFVYEKMPK